MSQDQCPSTRGKKEIPSSRALNKTGSTSVWRSPEELAGDPGIADWLEREFPAGASELGRRTGESRREFMKLMGAGLALAGAATIPGCRRPDHKIVTYSRGVPEDSVPGVPLYFATSMPLPGGGAEGLIVETHEGRPTKIEGNPLHPINRGKSSSWSLSSILDLYDPDRLKGVRYDNPARGVLGATLDDFLAWQYDHFRRMDTSGGSGIALILDHKTSPSLAAAVDRFRRRFPRADIVVHNAADTANAAEGARIAFGSPRREILEPETADVIVAIDRNFLDHEPGSLVSARQFAAGRRPMKAGDRMSRLYSVESGVSETGAAADHRMRMAPSSIPAFVVRLARAVMDQVGGDSGLSQSLADVALSGEPTQREADFVEAAAADLASHRGTSLVCVGKNQPAWVHALVWALNSALGNTGRTVRSLPAPTMATTTLAELASRMQAGQVSTLLCLDSNPVYDAPADLGFAELYSSVENTVSLSVGPTETSEISTWRLNGAHYLEAWGDTEALDGTIAPIQPMIAPLYGRALSDLELVSLIADGDEPVGYEARGYELVRAAWRERLGSSGPAFDRIWRRALHDGVLAGSAPRNGMQAGVDNARVASGLSGESVPAGPSAESLDVVFATGIIHDGRFANRAWLQELPQTATRLVWDNAALLSPATAEALGLEPPSGIEGAYTATQLPKSRIAELTVDGRKVTIPVWVMPGMADNTVILPLGYGRRECGSVGTGVGVDVYPVRTGATLAGTRGATAQRARGTAELVSTQIHWSMESRTSIVRQVDLQYFNEYADEKVKPKPDKIYGIEGRDVELNLAEQMGELSHTPANISIYPNPMNRGPKDPDPDNPITPDELGNTPAKALNRTVGPAFSRGPQWGMSIDQSSCTGCGACTIACQSENNIPVVGKREVAKGREMAWIRVDRYYTGDDLNEPDQILHQPVACVHCENAPCEVVCPVNATVHGPEGTNDMVYNRCIGTRYCSNNCPYKVRRFNFFDYAQVKFNGGAIEGLEILDNVPNRNFIPPRLRKQMEEIEKMRQNPDVTVRGRGVMEKCTYCIQRINVAKVEVKLKGLNGPDGSRMPDGFVQSACQQACPSDAISFGDILDASSRVHDERENPRSYMLLGYLNTRPRTTHMLRVNNPNPALREPVDPLAGHGHDDGHGESHGDDHGGESHGDDHAFVDPAGKARDKGYAMSLRVLGAASGVMA
ncbi:MAG: TAT-variant-translocated molybdopterin oxidoreductase [Planctomycetota bacterium]